VGGFLLAAALAAGGCGGSATLRLSLARDASFERPTYVGAYFLSQESVLDGEPLVDLIDKPEQYTEGVVRKEFVTVYPGDTKVINLEAYDPKIGWIVVVADLADSPCARIKQAVEPGSSLRMQVAVEKECLTLVAAP
jgi:hypothetical protein